MAQGLRAAAKNNFFFFNPQNDFGVGGETDCQQVESMASAVKKIKTIKPRGTLQRAWNLAWLLLFCRAESESASRFSRV